MRPEKRTAPELTTPTPQMTPPVSYAAAAALDMERALTARETGVLLGLHEVTLQQWRARGEGPRFIKLGAGRRPAIRYILRDVLAFRNARAVGKSP